MEIAIIGANKFLLQVFIMVSSQAKNRAGEILRSLFVPENFDENYICRSPILLRDNALKEIEALSLVSSLGSIHNFCLEIWVEQKNENSFPELYFRKIP